MELVELVTDYLEGALPPSDRRRFEEHLTTCPHCRTYLDQMRQTAQALTDLPADALPGDARSTLLNAFRSRRA